MATGVEDDEYEEEPAGLAKQPPPLITTTGVDKTAATQKERMLADVGRVQERRCGIIMGAFVVLLLMLFLALLGSVLFLGPDPDVPFTPATQRVLTTANPGKHTYPDNNTHINDTETMENLHYDSQERSSAGVRTDPGVTKLFCATVDCQATVRFLEDGLDAAYDPCTDLYDHVCSKWKQGHESLANKNGRFSVDDVFVDEYLDALIAVLADNGTGSSEQSGLLQDCINGSLVAKDDVTDILKGIPSTGNNSIEGIAKTIAEMAFLGVSPFFDVVSNVANETVKITLLSPLFSAERISDDVSDADVEVLRKSVESERGTKSAFFNSLGRQLCFEVNRMVGSVKHCLLTSASSITPPWNYRWYETTGMQRLSRIAAEALQPFSAFAKENALPVNYDDRLSPLPEKTIRRLRSCLRLIARHDDYQFHALVARSTLPTLERDAKKALRILKTSLDETFPSASNISLALGPAPALDNKTHNANYERDSSPGKVSNADSKIKRLLHATTWSQWTGHRGKRSGLLSTDSNLVKSSSTVYVPMPVFNSTFTEDRWLQALSLARLGPRALKTLFLEGLASGLRDSLLTKCILKRKTSHRTAVARPTADIDIAEAAAFFVALRAYRRQVGEAMAISGSLLNSDSLFLLYYVFNNCEAISEDPTARSEEPPGGRGKRLVDSVTAMFPSILFEQCQAPLDPPGCDLEIKSPALSPQG